MIEAKIPTSAANDLREARWDLSDTQLATFGVYELTAAKYEVQCGLQGSAGVADPTLLGAYIDAPAG